MWRGGQRIRGGVDSRICDAGSNERFAAFHAGAAFAAIHLASFVTGPRSREVDPETRAFHRNISLVQRDKRPEQFYALIRSRSHCLAHRAHEVLTTVGIDGVIAPVRRNNESFSADALSESACDGKHDRVAERNDRLPHVLGLVMTFRNFPAAL